MTYITCAQLTASQATQDAAIAAAAAAAAAAVAVAAQTDCAGVLACVTALPTTTVAVPGTTALLGNDGAFHVLSPVVAGAQLISVSGATLSISGGNSVVLPDAQTLAVTGNTLSISGGNSITLSSKLAASGNQSDCFAVGLSIAAHAEGDVLFTSGITISNPSATLPATGTWTAELNSIYAITYPGAFYAITHQANIDSLGWQDLGKMTFANSTGAAASSIGSGFPSSTRSIYLAAGGSAVILFRIVLSSKFSATVGDVIDSLCYANSYAVVNHD
jgi:hypothetical protein